MSTLRIDGLKNRTILLVIGSLRGGGAERQMSDMANFWAAEGCQVVLATWSGLEIPDFFPLDARVRRLSVAERSGVGEGQSRIRQNLERVRRLKDLMISVQPNAVLSFVTESNLLTILAGTGLRTRIVVSERVQPALHTAVPWVWRILRFLIYRRADAVVAQTRAAAQWIRRSCGTRAIVIPNALRILPEPHGVRENVIVAVGRLTHQKGFDLLLRAFALIGGTCADWRVAILGEGEERDSLARLRRELSLDDRVEFVGQTSDVVAWMARAGLVVQPSRFEGFPNVVLESMGLGAAVISADCPSGPADLIEDGINGRLVPVDDVAALAKVMQELISMPDERARLGRAATGVRERYRQEVVMGLWDACLFPRSAKGKIQVSEFG